MPCPWIQDPGKLGMLSSFYSLFRDFRGGLQCLGGGGIFQSTQFRADGRVHYLTNVILHQKEVTQDRDMACSWSWQALHSGNESQGQSSIPNSQSALGQSLRCPHRAQNAHAAPYSPRCQAGRQCPQPIWPHAQRKPRQSGVSIDNCSRLQCFPQGGQQPAVYS